MDAVWLTPADDHPQHERSAGIDGHFTEPNEQNMQESPGDDRNSTLQFSRSSSMVADLWLPFKREQPTTSVQRIAETFGIGCTVSLFLA